MKRLKPFTLMGQSAPENFHLSWVLVSVFLISANYIFFQPVTVQTVYFMFVAFVLMVSTAFGSVIAKGYVRLYFFLAVTVALPAFGSYAVLSNPWTVLSSSFWNICLFLTMLLVPTQLFPLSLFTGVLVGVTVFVLSPHAHVASLRDVVLMGSHTAIFLVVWYFIYRQKALKLDEQEKALKESAMAINHELTTYLTSVKLNLMAMRNQEGIEPIYGSLAKIEKSVDCMSVFLEVLQGNFRDSFPVKGLGPHSIASLIDKAVEVYPLQAGERALIHMEGEDFAVHMDPTIFRHVMFNLLGNALFFIKKADKGSISIRFYPGSAVNSLFFEDTGYGIRQEYLPRIFERFFTQKRHGTGMGLFFCKNALETYGATITCESVFGSYTRFKMEFPKGS